MDTPCEAERCRRCAMARGYPDQPRLSQPPPSGWDEVVAEVRRLSVPLVAFGQTIFWDEPAKAVLRLVLDQAAPEVLTCAGVHDSDYFSKLHGRARAGQGFVVWSNNDWTNRELWAAVGETTSLFGAEAPPKVAELQAAGVPLRRLAALEGRDESGFLDQATAAYGWRGVAQLGAAEQIARDVLVRDAGGALTDLFDWGLRATIDLLASPEARRTAAQRGAALLSRLQAAVAEMGEATVSQLYQRLIGEHYADLLGYESDRLLTTATVDYLRFNRATAGRPRFQPVQAFLCHRVGRCARETYNEVIAGQGMYELDQFGEGAIPFDLILPGRGRGTLRVLDREVRAEFARQPLVIPTAERVVLLEDLAALLEEAVGPEAAIVGKALLGPVMFCSEAVLVLHDGASGYVPRTRLWLSRLNRSCGSLRAMPILRLRHRAYDALARVSVSLRLPEHLAEAFGKPEVTGQEFGRLWREILRQQQDLLSRLRQATSLGALLDVVSAARGDDWERIAAELAQARRALRHSGQAVEERRAELARVRTAEREARRNRSRLERESGALRRAEQETGDPQPRRRLREGLAALTARIDSLGSRRAALRAEIAGLTRGVEAQAARQTISRLSLIAQRERLALARRALLTRNLELGNRRPTWWWFPILDPSGEWFAEAARLAEVGLEDLTTSDEEEPTGAAA